MAGIPLSDDYRVRRVPAVTYLLIAANVSVYLLSPMSMLAFWYGDSLMARLCPIDIYVAQWGAIPVELLSGQQLPYSGECSGADYTKIPWVSAFTAMFLHGDAIHLLSNMVYLFVFGPVVEDRLGRLRYLGLYTVTGLIATYAYALGTPDADMPLVGASGAVSGVLGAYLLVQRRSRIIFLALFVLPIRLPGWVLVGTYFVIQYFLYVSVSLFPGADGGNVAYAAHVYGFIGGVIGGLLIHRIRWRSGTRLSDVY
ncbi:rhomboid family intramembrane serine protease [Nocardiopsis gilva YIM 90087]|uniref:Rhomboid family intramembrane serine protease n=1 Tax=Nocardiopsis gilva YIM 90087 TaxID=1235441 RepID=A0A223S5L6_9ACTN|nr:rhomboid family intramembrane serine protease [Nocardiopsis gilva]ASU83319.1 rhomboid family intramembrane serine protease [Nocardiopsis gilva YIM 90087]